MQISILIKPARDMDGWFWQVEVDGHYFDCGYSATQAAAKIRTDGAYNTAVKAATKQGVPAGGQ